ncbi:MAG: hypothetical protein QM680_01490 [Luteolibacter sp.]
MKNLYSWTLVEGRIPGQPETRSPTISQVIAAIEAITPEMDDSYVILSAPPEGNTESNYCQILAVEEGYWCEIRLFGSSGDDFRHYRLLHPDEFGNAGSFPLDHPDWVDGYDPDLQTVLSVFTGFMEAPHALPEVGKWEWVDITEEIDEQ